MSLGDAPRTAARKLLVAALAAASLAPLATTAAEFHLYLNCSGTFSGRGKTSPVDLNLAMRDNNLTALIQRSNFMPVGERMRYVASEMAYTMTFQTPQPGTRVYQNFFGGPILILYPDPSRVAATRLSVDRQTGGLDGELVNAQGQRLANFRMACTPTSMDDVPAPKF